MLPLFIRLAVLLALIAVSARVTSRLFARIWPGAWARWLRTTLRGTAVVAIAGAVLWTLGRALEIHPVAALGAFVTALVFASMFAVAVSAVFWGPVGLWAARPPSAPNASTPNASRRAFLRRATAVVPASAVAAGPVGALGAALTIRTPHIPVTSAHVPAALHGLKILQVSDLHLGPFIGLDHVDAIVEAARAHTPDLVLLTGDIADDFDLLPGALERLRTLAPPLGMWSSIGNHEIFRGRKEAITAFGAGGARFFSDDGTVLSHNGARFFLGGLNDPGLLRGDHAPFFADAVERTLNKCPADVTCRILMSHRPQALVPAAAHDVTVVLSGHTHGGQMALFGRSLLEAVWPEGFLLGRYRRGDTTLYTTAGAGHWFPFRLNCPTEVAVVELRAPGVAVA